MCVCGVKDEKNFEKRVKQYVKLLKGKRLKSVVTLVNQLDFQVHFINVESTTIFFEAHHFGKDSCASA